MNKICCRCHKEKIINEFHKDSSKPCGYSYACKMCVNETVKVAYNKKPKKERLKYYYTNKEKCLAKSKEYKNKNFLARREYMRNYERKKMKEDPAYMLRKYIGGRVRSAIKAQKAQKKDNLLELCGAGYNAIREHLENLFKPGMSWDNHGQWHIDHIIPISKFDLTNPDEIKKACYYKNLQPLWAHENLSKGSRCTQSGAKN